MMFGSPPQVFPTLPISQVPTPPTIQMIAVAKMNRDMPASVIRKPSTRAGTVLAIRCSQFAWSSGANKMPIRPSDSNGLMPLLSRRSPLSWFKTSTM